MPHAARPAFARDAAAEAVAVAGDPAVDAPADRADGGPAENVSQGAQHGERGEQREEAVVAAGEVAGGVEDEHLAEAGGAIDHREGGHGGGVLDVDEIQRGGRAEALDGAAAAGADAAVGVVEDGVRGKRSHHSILSAGRAARVFTRAETSDRNPKRVS